MSSRAHGERGAVMLMVTFSLIAFFGLAALALDVGRMYIIESQLQNAADAGALRAAKALDGTAARLTVAVSKAREAARHNGRLLAANPLADADITVQFASKPFPADWAMADAVCRAALTNNCYFARVDTSAQGIASFFAGIIGVNVNAARALAVAGLYPVRVTPLAMCAINFRNCPRKTGGCDESSPYGCTCGYVPGKAYTVSEVNVNFVGAGTHLWFNPLATTRDECMTNGLGSAEQMRPYVCQDGKVSPVVTVSDYVYTDTGVSNLLYGALDSRFGIYPPAAQCDPEMAPPDTNVMEFRPSPGVARWMNQTPLKQTATTVPTTFDRAILTADNHGVVWAFARTTANPLRIDGRPLRLVVPPEPNPPPHPTTPPR